jgi:hypothetical protein
MRGLPQFNARITANVNCADYRDGSLLILSPVAPSNTSDPNHSGQVRATRGETIGRRIAKLADSQKASFSGKKRRKGYFGGMFSSEAIK